MNFQRTMLSIAMESGEIEPEVYEEPSVDDLIAGEDLGEDLTYAFEQRAAEMVKAIDFIASFEALNDSIVETDLTQVAFENYEQSVSKLLIEHGSQIPLVVLVPSFEAAEADKKSIKDKASSVINGVWEWIKTQYKKMVAMIGRLNVFARAKLARVQKAASDLKARMSKAPEKTAEKPAEASTESAGGIQVFTWMTEDGKLSPSAALTKMAVAYRSHEYRRVIQVLNGSGSPILSQTSINDPVSLGNELKKMMDENPQEKYFDTVLKPLVTGPSVSITDYAPKQVTSLSDMIVKQMEDEVKFGDDLRKKMGPEFLTYLERALKGKDRTNLMAIRGCVQRVATINARVLRLNEQGIEVLNKMHSKVESISKLRAVS